jgi:transcriptional regulator with XRE-family HTH domain
MNQIGSKISWLLNTRNISRKKFASDIDFSDHTIQKILSNERALDTDEIEKIAEYFHMKPIELEYGEAKIVFENKDNVSINNQGNNYQNDQSKLIESQEKQIASLLKQIDFINSEKTEIKLENIELKKEIKLTKKN